MKSGPVCIYMSTWRYLGEIDFEWYKSMKRFPSVGAFTTTYDNFQDSTVYWIGEAFLYFITHYVY